MGGAPWGAPPAPDPSSWGAPPPYAAPQAGGWGAPAMPPTPPGPGPAAPAWGAPAPAAPSPGGAPASPDPKIAELEAKCAELRRDVDSIASFARTLLVLLEDKGIATEQLFAETKRKLDAR